MTVNIHTTPTGSMQVNDAFTSLELRTGTLYRIHSLRTTWSRDAAWTAATEYELRANYGIVATSLTGIRRYLAIHEAGFLSAAGTGVEWQNKTRSVSSYYRSLVVPQLVINWFADGVEDQSIRLIAEIEWDAVKVGKTQYMAVLKQFDIDEDTFIAPTRFKLG